MSVVNRPARADSAKSGRFGPADLGRAGDDLGRAGDDFGRTGTDLGRPGADISRYE